jgi:serpin B
MVGVFWRGQPHDQRVGLLSSMAAEPGDGDRRLTGMRAWVVGGAGLVLALGLAGCGGTAGIPAGPEPLRAANVARIQPAADAPVSIVAAGITNLGYRLGAGHTGNWVVSPASIAYAFAMVRAGANGPTATEIDQAFGFPTAGLGDAFNAITRQVTTVDTPPAPSTKKRKPGEIRPTVMTMSNALFPQSGYPIEDGFLRTLAEQYGAGVYPVDFGGSAAKDTIDAWVTAQTAGRVSKLFDRLDPATKLVLANTVYLRADWLHPFGETPTVDGQFRRADGTTVTVAMMAQSEQLRYARGPGWQAVELPYQGGQLAMRILLPDNASVPPRDLLAPAVMTAVGAGLAPAGVALTLPKWDTATELSLVDTLRTLGVRTAFDTQADFAGISPNPLMIDQATHRADITVDEAGTEAAAATGLSMVPTMARAVQATVNVDHPFAFAIVHTGTGVPVFVGQVADPSQHRS